jgi:hypothetical protein
MQKRTEEDMSGFTLGDIAPIAKLSQPTFLRIDIPLYIFASKDMPLREGFTPQKLY